MELIEQLYFRMVTPSDFRNMYGLAIPGSGGGQTYIEVAGISDENVLAFLDYAERNESTAPAENRPTFVFNCHVLGNSQQQAFLEFAPRRGRNYKISRQTLANRHPAWLPENGFPEPEKNAGGAYVDSSDFSGIIDHLLIVILRSSLRKYYASFFNDSSMPVNWPKNIGLEGMFSGTRCGVLDFRDCQVELLQDRNNPFRFVSGTKALLSSFTKTHYPLQRIFYGAPGTGKSKGIKNLLRSEPNDCVFRTTFHPDSDYSSFVGNYKPAMRDPNEDDCVEVYRVTKAKGQEERSLDEIRKTKGKRIAYEFVPQVFLEAYAKAWEEFTKDDSMSVFLIIEEINRGNCAQIFGDLFQLLDRHDKTGCSEYPIVPDCDMRDHLENVLKKTANSIAAAKKDEINVFLAEATDKKVSLDDIFAGRSLVLPPNFHIWATMNTSDQSLFPMDSAFKRRWDWKYVPIRNHPEEDYRIAIGGETYRWWPFITEINKRILSATESEDKKLGYFFVKAEKGSDGKNVIDADKFLNKVIFYLWNDVFKNSEPEKAFKFERPDGKKDIAAFQDFFKEEDGSRDDGMLKAFLKGLGVEAVAEEAQENATSPSASPLENSTFPPVLPPGAEE